MVFRSHREWWHPFKNNRGGLQWVEDMLDIMKANGLHFTYHNYSGESFGIYPEDGVLPDPSHANKPLMELFKGRQEALK